MTTVANGSLKGGAMNPNRISFRRLSPLILVMTGLATMLLFPWNIYRHQGAITIDGLMTLAEPAGVGIIVLAIGLFAWPKKESKIFR